MDSGSAFRASTDLAVEKREVARVDGNGHVRRRPEDPIEELVEDLHRPGGLTLDPLAVDDVEPLPPLLHEVLDQLGRVLEISVEEHDGIPARDAHAARERALRAEVPGVVDDDDAFVATREVGQDLGGVVGARVVHEDDLVVDPDPLEDLREPLVHLRDGGRVAVARDDRAHARLVRVAAARFGCHRGFHAAHLTF